MKLRPGDYFFRPTDYLLAVVVVVLILLVILVVAMAVLLARTNFDS
jgi:hypothetical protein